MTPEEFKNFVRKYAHRIGVKPVEIHIRKMQRKWASCSSRGRLTFDTSLLNEHPETYAKVIVHELLHLKYPNHGKMFKALLKTHLSENNRKSKVSC